MKIGIFTDQYYPFVSGVVTSINLLYDGLEALGHEVYIFTSLDPKKTNFDDPVFKEKHVVNIPGKKYPFPGLRDYRYTFTHRRFIKIVKPYNLDVMHIQTEFNIAKVALTASKKLGIPVVHTLHTLYKDYFKYFSPFLDKYAPGLVLLTLNNLFTKPVTKGATIQIVPTQKVFEQKDTYGLGKDVRIIPTGIDLNRFNPNNFTKNEIEDLKSSLNIKNNQFVFLYLGRLSKEKNVPVLLHAYAKSLAKEPNNSVLVIAGGGPDIDSLKALSEELNIKEHVRFTDWIKSENAPIYYQLADIFINASQSETQGLTYLEALASGIPLLVQRDDCINGVISDYYNGIYFDGEDDLALKMVEINKAPDTLKTIKSNTLKSVENYSKEKFVQNIVSIYEEAIEKNNETLAKKKKKK